jgi:hypothetical protein
MAYHVDADDLSLSSHRQVLSGRPTISLTCEENQDFDSDTVESVKSFCQKNLLVQTVASTTEK